MKAPPFRYHRPDTLAEALALLAEHGDDAKVLAGGQSLVPLMAMRMGRPAVVVDIGRVPGLADIEVGADGSCSIGALVRHAAAERSADVASHAPLVHRAMPLIAHRAIRTRGTVVGSIAHADPAAEMPAVAVAVGATMTAASASGERSIAASDFFEGYLQTALRADEILTRVTFPAWPAGAVGSVVEVARRHGDYALVGLVTSIQLDGGRITDAALTFFGAASTTGPCPRGRASPDRNVGASRHGGRGREDRGRRARSTGRHPRHDGLSEAPRRRPHPPRPGRSRRHDRSVRMTESSTVAASSVPDATTRRLDAERRAGGDVIDVGLVINGVRHDVTVEARRTLSDVIRDDCGLTGTHVGCEHGVCGACTVLIDGEPARSCLMFAGQADGADITTIEGLAGPDGTLHPIQQAMMDAHGFQCAFCSPGFLMSAVALLAENPDPTTAEIREELSGNICRCTGYQSIVAGVERAVEVMKASAR